MGLAWDPNNEYQLPKDFGTTGVLYRSKVVKEPVTSWQEFYDLSKGKYSGKVVLVDSMGDVMTMPLKMIGKSLNSVEKEDLDQVRTLLLDLAPHILALDSDTYQDKLASEEAVLCLGWTGPSVELRANPETADIAYTVPSDGTLFWLDTGVLIADAPNPNAAYAFLNFIHEPEIQAEETNFNGYGTPNDEARASSPAASSTSPSIASTTSCRCAGCAASHGSSAARKASRSFFRVPRSPWTVAMRLRSTWTSSSTCRLVVVGSDASPASSGRERSTIERSARTSGPSSKIGTFPAPAVM
jgi:hypothetical protein